MFKSKKVNVGIEFKTSILLAKFFQLTGTIRNRRRFIEVLNDIEFEPLVFSGKFVGILNLFILHEIAVLINISRIQNSGKQPICLFYTFIPYFRLFRHH